MRHFGKLIFVSYSIFVCIEPGPSHRIIDGTPANITDFPYQVSIQFNGSHECGGSIINPRYILTAAHCFVDLSPNIEVSVIAGTSTWATGGQKRTVVNTTFHDEYKPYGTVNDLAVLELDSPLTNTDGASSIPLASNTTSSQPGDLGVLTGWGTTNASEMKASPVLQVVAIPIISNDKCQEHYGTSVKDYNRIVCVLDPVGTKDGCFGDSGGPLVVNGVQIGVFSFGRNCAAGYPSVFGKVSAFRPFIDKVIA
ncbi:trypsin-2-like [Cylas formicarius]|uniref:trypsin-2-like n=1 Tax=Cylas formicarius TaxID=197179 RepID=UPI002958C2DE|nr:trypsin-2-like [Cylas formicarius]